MVPVDHEVHPRHAIDLDRRHRVPPPHLLRNPLPAPPHPPRGRPEAAIKLPPRPIHRPHDRVQIDRLQPEPLLPPPPERLHHLVERQDQPDVIGLPPQHRRQPRQLLPPSRPAEVGLRVLGGEAGVRHGSKVPRRRTAQAWVSRVRIGGPTRRPRLKGPACRARGPTRRRSDFGSRCQLPHAASMSSSLCMAQPYTPRICCRSRWRAPQGCPQATRPPHPARSLVQRALGLHPTRTLLTLSHDHLDIDGRGVPHRGQVKRGSKTEIRREIVGQLLDSPQARDAAVLPPQAARELRSKFTEVGRRATSGRPRATTTRSLSRPAGSSSPRTFACPTPGATTGTTAGGRRSGRCSRKASPSPRSLRP